MQPPEYILDSNVDWVKALYGSTSLADYEIIKNMAGEATVMQEMATPTFRVDVDGIALGAEGDLPGSIGGGPDLRDFAIDPMENKSGTDLWPWLLAGIGLLFVMSGRRKR